MAIQREIQLGMAETATGVRVIRARPLARKMVRGFLVEIRAMFQDIIKVLEKYAEREGQKFPSHAEIGATDKSLSAIGHTCGPNCNHDIDLVSKLISLQDLAEIASQFYLLFPLDLIADIENIFETYSVRIGDAFENAIPLIYSFFLNYEFNQQKRTLGTQNPRRFFNTPEIILHIDNPFYRAFVENGLELIRDKITVQFKGEVYKIIARGIEDNKNWLQIARDLNKKIGLRARWHWVRLARSETQRASYLAGQQRAFESGAEYEYFSPLNNACPICRPLRGYYSLGEGPAIPVHPNCRCRNLFYYDLPQGVKISNLESTIPRLQAVL